MKTKSLDFFIILIYIFAIIFSARFVFASSGNSTEVIIENNEHKWVFPIDRDQRLSIDGSIGKTEIEIHDHQVSVLSSPCKNKLCISKGHISHNGQWLACLPNGIFIIINGSKSEKQTDAVSF